MKFRNLGGSKKGKERQIISKVLGAKTVRSFENLFGEGGGGASVCHGALKNGKKLRLQLQIFVNCKRFEQKKKSLKHNVISNFNSIPKKRAVFVLEIFQ